MPLFVEDQSPNKTGVITLMDKVVSDDNTIIICFVYIFLLNAAAV